MKSWSFQLGRVAGIPIRVHFTFLLLVIWFAAVRAQAGDNIAVAVLFLLLVFGCVVLHELGHALMARVYGVRTIEIVLYPIGGIARLRNMPTGAAELFVALAGPAVNLVLAVVLFVAILVLGQPLTPQGLLSPGDLLAPLWFTNLALFLFNLLPAFPMDGGRVLRAGLSLIISPLRATEIATAVGQSVAIVLGLVGLFGKQPLLILIALFVFVGAAQEARYHRQRASVLGKTARAAMITRFETLAPQDSLQHAATHLIATHQQDFPVVDAWRRVVGILPRGRLLQGLAEAGGPGAVLDVMSRDVPAVAPDTDLDRVLDLLRGRPGCPVIVLEDDQLVGMVTLENLTEFIEISRTQQTGGAQDQSR